MLIIKNNNCKVSKFLTPAVIFAPSNIADFGQSHPKRTSAFFRGEGGPNLATFADSRGLGVSEMQTSAIFEYITQGNVHFLGLYSQNITKVRI